MAREMKASDSALDCLEKKRLPAGLDQSLSNLKVSVLACEMKARGSFLFCLENKRLPTGLDQSLRNLKVSALARDIKARTCALFRMPLMLGRLSCPGGSNPFWHPLTESSGVVGVDPPHLRCSSRLAARLESRTGRAGGWFDVASRGLMAAGRASSSRFASQVVVPVRCFRSTTTFGISPRVERR